MRYQRPNNVYPLVLALLLIVLTGITWSFIGLSTPFIFLVLCDAAVLVVWYVGR